MFENQVFWKEGFEGNNLNILINDNEKVIV